MRKQFYKFLTELYKSDPRVAVLLGDIGVFSLQGLFEHDPRRAYNMGIMEQTMVGVAGGLASRGYIPFVHSIAPFVTERCYEQLKLDLAYERRNAFVVSVGNSYDYAALGCTHHCPNDLRIMSAIPGFKTYCPGNSGDVERIIKDTIALPCPKYIRLSETENNLRDIAISRGDLEPLQVHSGGFTIVVGNAVKDFERLLSAGVSSTIAHTCNISEFDVAKVHRLVESNGWKKKITVVEPSADSGIVSKLAPWLKNIESLNRIGVPDFFIDHYGSKAEIDRYLGLDDDSIITRLKAIYP